MNDQPSLEVCFSPKLYDDKMSTGKFTTVVVDILRASTSICAAFDHGIQEIIPVSGLEDAKRMKKNGYLVACERDGHVMDFADIGNSASDFIRDDLVGKQLVFSTTNGTKTINQARDADEVVIGSFVNLKSLAKYLIDRQQPVVVFCAAWKNLFNLEDSVFAGALSDLLLKNGFITDCDSALAAMDLWQNARDDLHEYLSKCSHRNRLNHLVSEADYKYTVALNSSEVIPVLRGDTIQLLNS